MRIHSTYSRKARIKKKRNWKLVFGLIFLALLFAGAAYILFFSPLLKIKKIDAQGTNKISASEFVDATGQYLSGFWLKVISKNNYLLVSGQELTDYLHDKFPGLKEINVHKKFPSVLIIEAKDRQKAITYCGQIRCFCVDDEGVAFEDAPEIYGGVNITLKDDSNREIKISDKALDSDLISFILQVQKLINDEISLGLVGFKIGSYPTTDLIAITPEDWQIFFDINLNPKEQVDVLKRILEEKIKDQRNRLEYVDLRIGNRVYYKYR